MAQTFKKDAAGIRRLLQSKECLQLMEKYGKREDGEETRPFVGFDRAKCFVKKSEMRNDND